MARDTILDEVTKEAQIRRANWARERDGLLAAAARIAELDDMIAGADTELEAFYKRKPALRPADKPATFNDRVRADLAAKAAKVK